MAKKNCKRISPSMAFLLLAALVLGVAVAGYTFLGSKPLPAGGGVSQGTASSVGTQAPSSGNSRTDAASAAHGRPLDNARLILQNPELPTGCEATAAAMLLRAHGYDVDKETMARTLPTGKFTSREGRLYGPHPNEAFPGNPFTKAGYGVFAAPVRRAMESIIAGAGGSHTVTDLTGAAEEAILAYIDKGQPVCIWATMGLMPVAYRSSWYIQRENGAYTDERFTWPDNEHCMVLIGYTDTAVTVLDPLKGELSYDRRLFFRRHKDVGGFALVLE